MPSHSSNEGWQSAVQELQLPGTDGHLLEPEAMSAPTVQQAEQLGSSEGGRREAARMRCNELACVLI